MRNDPTISRIKTDKGVFVLINCRESSENEGGACKIPDNVKAFVPNGTNAFRGFFDPETLAVEAAWEGGLAVEQGALESVGGIDGRLGVCRDTDLVWRLASKGIATSYLPSIKLSKETADESLHVADMFLLRCKYGKISDIISGLTAVLKAVRHPEAYKVRRGVLLRRFFMQIFKAVALLLWRTTHRSEFAASPASFEVLEKHRCERDFKIPEASCKPLVSVVVRTCNGHETLMHTLNCLQNQTYGNFEVIVVEDGPETLAETLKRDYSDMDINYIAVGENRGRSAAANVGFAAARGSYINLLDDDDYFYPEHLETGVALLEESGKQLAFFDSVALKDGEPPRIMSYPDVNEFEMARRCVAASCGVMFDRGLFERLGGMREELKADEDWALWLKYMTGKSYITVRFATSAFTVPDDDTEKRRREEYSVFDDMMLDDELMEYGISKEELDGFYKDTVNGFLYLDTLGAAERHLMSEREFARRTVETIRTRPCSFDLFTGDGPFTLSARQLREMYCCLVSDGCRSIDRGEFHAWLEKQKEASGL